MAGIKISELSIGDWINQKMNDGAYQVQWIERETVGLIKHTGTEEEGSICLTAVPLSFIEPIPLTPEILEKNGFDAPKAKVWNDSWYWSNRKDVALELRESFGLWYMEIVTKEQRLQSNRKLGIGFKAVHQLQHALRLAGVEKSIEL